MILGFDQVLLLHGICDKTIPFTHSQRLFEVLTLNTSDKGQAPQLELLRPSAVPCARSIGHSTLVLTSCGHNDFNFERDVLRNVRALLQSLCPEGTPRALPSSLVSSILSNGIQLGEGLLVRDVCQRLVISSDDSLAVSGWVIVY
jgi:hypothetical protein